MHKKCNNGKGKWPMSDLVNLSKIVHTRHYTV
jgi:hypothetical protein